MKSTKFAVGGDEAKIAALGGALAENVLDDASAEERDDSGGDESDGGKHDGDNDSSEVEGAEALFKVSSVRVACLCVTDLFLSLREDRSDNCGFDLGETASGGPQGPLPFSPCIRRPPPGARYHRAP